MHIFRKLFSFSGRTGRLSYVLAAWIFPIVCSTLLQFWLDAALLRIVLYIPMIAIVAAFTARRLHDLNFSAWWLLSSTISALFFSQRDYFFEILPLWVLAIGALMSVLGNLYLVIVPGHAQENRYGAPLHEKVRDFQL